MGTRGQALRIFPTHRHLLCPPLLPQSPSCHCASGSFNLLPLLTSCLERVLQLRPRPWIKDTFLIATAPQNQIQRCPLTLGKKQSTLRVGPESLSFNRDDTACWPKVPESPSPCSSSLWWQRGTRPCHYATSLETTLWERPAQSCWAQAGGPQTIPSFQAHVVLDSEPGPPFHSDALGVCLSTCST